MLARANRVTSAVDYRRITRSGHRRRGELVLAYARRTAPDAPLRMGVIVAKNVGNAVVRNRVRRRIKAVAWSLTGQNPGLDVVVRALPPASTASWPALRDEVCDAVAALAAEPSRRARR